MVSEERHSKTVLAIFFSGLPDAISVTAMLTASSGIWFRSKLFLMARGIASFSAFAIFDRSKLPIQAMAINRRTSGKMAWFISHRINLQS